MTPTPPPTTDDQDAIAHSRAITYLLLGMTVLFALILIAIDKVFPNEGQVFQVIANLTSGFAGAFMTRIQAPVRGTPGSPATNGTANPLPTLPNIGQAAAALQAALQPTSAAPPATPAPGPTPIKPLGMQP